MKAIHNREAIMCVCLKVLFPILGHKIQLHFEQQEDLHWKSFGEMKFDLQQLLTLSLKSAPLNLNPS